MRGKRIYWLVLFGVLVFTVTPAECTSLLKTEFMPLEQVNIRINNVSGWIRPVNVNVLLNGYPVATQVYDAGSDLYVSFLMPNGNPENLTLRVIAVDLNQTNTADTTLLIKRVESNEIVQNKMLMENLIALINPRLDNLVALEQEVREILIDLRLEVGNVNGTLIAELNNASFELSQELDALQEELAILRGDTADVKGLVVGINEAAHSGNVVATDIQSQVAEIQETVYKALAFSIISAVTSAVTVAVMVLRRSSEKK